MTENPKCDAQDCPCDALPNSDWCAEHKAEVEAILAARGKLERLHKAPVDHLLPDRYCGEQWHGDDPCMQDKGHPGPHRYKPLRETMQNVMDAHDREFAESESHDDGWLDAILTQTVGPTPPEIVGELRSLLVDLQWVPGVGCIYCRKNEIEGHDLDCRLARALVRSAPA